MRKRTCRKQFEKKGSMSLISPLLFFPHSMSSHPCGLAEKSAGAKVTALILPFWIFFLAVCAVASFLVLRFRAKAWGRAQERKNPLSCCSSRPSMGIWFSSICKTSATSCFGYYAAIISTIILNRHKFQFAASCLVLSSVLLSRSVFLGLIFFWVKPYYA